jgi:hypothetical protein
MVLAFGNNGDAALVQGQYKIVTGHQGGSGFWTGPIHPNASGPADPTRNASTCGPFSCCDGCLYDIQADPTEHSDLRVVMPTRHIQMYARLTELGNGTYQTNYIQPGIKFLDPWQAKMFYKGFRGTVRGFRQRFALEDAIGFPTPPARLKLLQACEQPHSSRVSTPLTVRSCIRVTNSIPLGCPRALTITPVHSRPNTEGPLCFNTTDFPVVPPPPPPPPPSSAFQLAHSSAPTAAAWCLTSHLGMAPCNAARPALAQLALQWRVGDPKSGELASAVDNGHCIKMDESQGWNCAGPGTNATVVKTGTCSGAGGGGAHKSNYFYLKPSSSGANRGDPSARCSCLFKQDCALSRMLLGCPPLLRLKREQACDQHHASRNSTSLTSYRLTL